MPSRENKEFTEFHLQLRVGREVLETRGQVPDAPLSVREFLPVLQTFTDGVMSSLSRQAEADGKPVSCGAGCGACCRQPVPIGEVEALRLAELVNAMPEERRDAVRARFGAALERLEEAGFLEKVRAFPTLSSPEDRQNLGLEYFRLGIPCPFLEDESCSIHPDRPLSCREYLVTSPAEACSSPDPERIAMVEVPRKLSYVLFRLGDGKGEAPARWLPLIFAPEAADRLRDRPEPEFPGKQLLETVVRHLRAPGASDS